MNLPDSCIPEFNTAWKYNDDFSASFEFTTNRLPPFEIRTACCCPGSFPAVAVLNNSESVSVFIITTLDMEQSLFSMKTVLLELAERKGKGGGGRGLGGGSHCEQEAAQPSFACNAQARCSVIFL